MSPEIQNKGISGPKIGHVYVSAKNIFKKKEKKKVYSKTSFLGHKVFLRKFKWIFYLTDNGWGEYTSVINPVITLSCRYTRRIVPSRKG